jgi:threonine/homoserine/homoserine lactone efflux protein
MTDPFLFVLAVLALLATPGPTNTLLATAGALHGPRRALRLIPAEIAGYWISVGLLMALAGPAVAGHPLITASLQACAALWLAVSARRLWREGNQASFAGRSSIDATRVFVTTLLNPKALIFAFAILPSGHPHVAVLGLLAFGGLVGVAATGWVTVGTVGARSNLALLSSRRIARAAAALLTGFATLLAGSAIAAVTGM